MAQEPSEARAVQDGPWVAQTCRGPPSVECQPAEQFRARPLQVQWRPPLAAEQQQGCLMVPRPAVTDHPARHQGAEERTVLAQSVYQVAGVVRAQSEAR